MEHFVNFSENLINTTTKNLISQRSNTDFSGKIRNNLSCIMRFVILSTITAPLLM